MKRIAAAGVVLLATLIVFWSVSFAASKEQEVVIAAKMANAVFQITWQNKAAAEITLVDPSGKEMNAASLGERYMTGEQSVSVVLPEPAIGTWKIRITGEGLGKVKISLSEYTDLIQLNNVSAQLQPDGAARIGWEAVNCEDNIQVSVFADTDKKGFDGEKLAEFYAGKAGNAAINLGGLSSGTCYFHIRVKSSNGVTDEQYVNDGIQYVNPNAPAAVQQVKAALVNDTIRVRWSKPEDPNVKAYKVLFFKQGEEGSIFSEITESADVLEYFSEPFEDRKLEVAVAAVGNNGLSGGYIKLPVDLDKLEAIHAVVKFPEKDLLNVHNLVIPVTLESGLKATLYLNNVKKAETEKSGSFAAEVPDGSNWAEVEVSDAEGNMKTFEKKFTVDTYAPQLTMYGNYYKTSTAAGSIAVSGEVEPGAKLYLNDRELTPGEDGMFVSKLDLKWGINRFTLKAVDVAGNEARYQGDVKRVIGSGLVYVLLLVVVSVGVLVFMGIVFRNKKKKKKEGAGQ